MQVITENCSPEVSAELQMVVQLLCLHKHALQQWQSDVFYSKMNFLILNKRFLNGTNIITNMFDKKGKHFSCLTYTSKNTTKHDDEITPTAEADI